MKKLVIYPYGLVSESGKLLAETFNAKKVRPDGNYRPQNDEIILNWGMSETPNWEGMVGNIKVINHWDAIKVSVNKLKTFEKLKAAGVNIPLFSTKIDDARQWIQNGDVIVCRKILCGSQGDGIVICKNLEELNVAAPDTKMFVRYFKRKKEFRVFVANGEIFDFSEKKKKEDFDGEHNTFVRNFAGGYIFARQNVVLPEIVKQQSIAAAAALNLQITAIDIGYNESQNLAVVFEANCSFAFDAGTTTFESVKKIINKYLGINENPIPAAITASPKIEVTPIITPSNQLCKNKLKDEIYKLNGITEIEFRSVDNTLKVYGKVAGRNNLIKILEINNPEISHFWED